MWRLEFFKNDRLEWSELLGVDVVESLINNHEKKYSKPNVTFLCYNFLKNPDFPQADYIFLKMLFNTGLTKDIINFLSSLISSRKTKYILLTNCCGQSSPHDDIFIGECRPLDPFMEPLKTF